MSDQPQASLTAQVRRGAPPEGEYSPEFTGVWADYEVTNTGTDPILVLTERGHGQSSGSTGAPIPQSVWVTQGPDGSARLSKQVFSAPSGMLPTDPWRAPAVLLEPGASLAGEVFALEPLATDVPAVSDSLTHEEQPFTGGGSTVQICIQVAASRGPEAYNDEITMDSPGRALVCSPVLDVPES